MSTVNTKKNVRRLSIGLGIVIILALLASIYFYFFVASQENKMNERSFRVLQQVEHNLNNRIIDYKRLAKSKLTSLDTCKDCIIDNIPDQARISQSFNMNDEFSVDSVIKKGKHEEWWIDKNRFNFIIPYGEKANNKVTCLSIEFENIITDILRNDVFDGFILHNEKNILFNTCIGLCNVKANDTIYKEDNSREITIGKNKYRQFSHPFNLPDGKTIVLSGLMTGQHYTNNKFGVSGDFILIVFVIIVIILLAFPFIKSFLMSAEETLDTRDVLFSLLSLFLICYLFIFFHSHVFTSLSHDETFSDTMLHKSNIRIQKSFVNELRSAIRQLNHFDSLHNKPEYSKNNYYSIKYNTRYIIGTLKDKNLKQDKIFLVDSNTQWPTSYKDFKRVFWIDRNGSLLQEWSNVSSDGASNILNYSERVYFKSVVNNDLWCLDNNPDMKFCLEPIFSWDDGIFRASISKHSVTKPNVVTMTSNLISVINTIQPEELDFAIITREGKTLFNSLGIRHIDENLLEECDNPGSLRAAIFTRSCLFENVQYLGNHYRMRISPIDNLPVFMVTFTKKSYVTNPRLQVFLFSTLFEILILLTFCFIILACIILRKRPKEQMVHLWDISWLYPSKKYALVDFASIIANFILIVILVMSTRFVESTPLCMFALFISTTIGTTAAFCYSRIEMKGISNFVFMGLILSMFMLIDCILLSKGNSENTGQVVFIIIFQITIIWIFSSLKKTPESIRKFGDGIVKSCIRNNFRWFRNFKFYHQYAIMLVTWFFLTAIIPGYYAYKCFYTGEKINILKHTQLNLAEKIYGKVNFATENKGSIFKIRDSDVTGDYTNIYTKHYYGSSIATDCKNQYKDLQNQEQKVLNNILGMFRISSRAKAGTPTILESGKKDETIQFNVNKDSTELIYRNLHNQPDTFVNTISIRSITPYMPVPDNKPYFISFMYAFSPLIFFFLFYLVIIYFLKRFFLFDFFPTIKKNKVIIENYFNRIKNDETAASKLCIVGLAAAGKSKVITPYLRKLKKDDFRIHKYDLAEDTVEIRDEPASIINTAGNTGNIKVKISEIIEKTDYTRKDIVIFRHFEHNLADDPDNDWKFNLIACLYQKKICPHIIILSAVHPSVFLKYLKTKFLRNDSGNTANSFKAEDYINQQEYYNWTGLLSSFDVYIQPLRVSESEVINFLKRADKYDNKIYYNLYREKYLYYLSVWNALERLEKFVLYDLAKDSLANYKNKLALYSLHAKGLIKNDDLPEISDVNFRNFIMCEIKESDVEAERVQSETSAWSKFKTPFLIIISVVLFIVFMTESDSFNKITALIGVFGTCMTIIIKLLPSKTP